MNEDLNDEKWNEALRDLAQEYHKPPMIVPREAMWGAIVAGQRRHRTFSLRRFAPLAAAAVVLLAVGVGLGRWSATKGEVTPVQQTALSQAVPEAYAIATTQQLVQAQALLTEFSANDRDAKTDARLASWARDLLSNTRLLLDSPAGADPRRRQLLEDLELVLVQIAELSPDAATSDRDAITRTLDHAQVLPRLKAAIPAGQVGL
jgi:hypothetical protein